MKKNKRKVFITGITGQDGAHLADLLLKKNYTVYGGFRRGSSNKLWRLDFLGITNKIKLIEFQLNEPQHIIEILKDINADEIYHLAGESFVADSFKYPGFTMESNTQGTINILEAVRIVSPNTKVFFASSSEIYGKNVNSTGVDETSVHFPSNPYGISKLAADYFVKLYREKYGLFTCSGILFNHEGPLRARQFVTRKITFNMARLKLLGGECFELGNFNSARDWGAAVDYVDAMRLMLTLDTPSDFVISSGKLTTVRSLLEMVATSVGFKPIFEGKDENEICLDQTTGFLLAKVSNKYYRPYDTEPMIGNSSQIKKHTGWNAKQTTLQMMELMVEADLYRRKKGIIDV
jgi:GDPmannose 4,6-dehydratase